MDALPETLDFIRKAKTSAVTITGSQTRGFAVGPSMNGDDVFSPPFESSRHTAQPALERHSKSPARCGSGRAACSCASCSHTGRS